MGGLGEYTRDPSYSTWERVWQEITKRHIGTEEEWRALEEMNKVTYKGKIDTYLPPPKNPNIKAGLTGIAWRVRVESGLPEDILRHLSHFKFANDEEWMEILRDVGRQEHELLEWRKLSRAITTPQTTMVKRKRDDTTKVFNTKFEKKGPHGYTDKQRKDFTSHWKALRKTPNQRTNSKDNSKDKHTDWKEAHKWIPDDAVAKRKRERRCTWWTLTNHIWRKCRKEAIVASAFINRKGQDRSKLPFKPRTSTLAVPQPRPQPKPTAKVNNVRQLAPTRIWEWSDYELPWTMHYLLTESLSP